MTPARAFRREPKSAPKAPGTYGQELRQEGLVDLPAMTGGPSLDLRFNTSKAFRGTLTSRTTLTVTEYDEGDHLSRIGE